MSLFNENPDAWYALLISLPPIDMEECAKTQRAAKRRLLAKREQETDMIFAPLPQSGAFSKERLLEKDKDGNYVWNY